MRRYDLLFFGLLIISNDDVGKAEDQELKQAAEMCTEQDLTK